jgi:DNA repair exonuclease SbcCD nuclease subunit
MLKLLHTADWHVGKKFNENQFGAEVSKKLARDRVSVIEQIMGRAKQYDVDAVLCAGDLFDVPDPGQQWWQAVRDVFAKCDQAGWNRPVILLPGNHDPLTRESVYWSLHPFRQGLPNWVHVVDRDDFALELNPRAVVYAAPCHSKAGDNDLALTLPQREEGDDRIRIGLVHGSTFDMAGYETNFPVSTDAPQRRGLDYLAIGDTHGFREIDGGSAAAPIVYPSTPEPTSFNESGAGFVAIVTFRRRGIRPRVKQERVAHWTWREITVQSLDELRKVAGENLQSTVVKLSLDLTVTEQESEEVDHFVRLLRGTEAVSARVGGLDLNRSRFRVTIDHSDPLDADLPQAIRDAEGLLQQQAEQSEDRERVVAQRAMRILRRMLREIQ